MTLEVKNAIDGWHLIDHAYFGQETRKIQSEIIKTIATVGPMPVEEWTRKLNSEYYHAHAGVGVDFDTPATMYPQLGENVANYILAVWQACGEPSFFPFYELGGGTAILAQKVLETIKTLPSFGNLATALEYHIVDLRRLPEDHANPDIVWHTQDASRFQFPHLQHGMYLSWEFMDDQPTAAIIKHDGVLSEMFVALNGSRLVITKGAPREHILQLVTQNPGWWHILQEDTIVPLPAASYRLLQKTASGLKQGAILTVDYGYQMPDWRHNDSWNSPFRTICQRIPRFSANDNSIILGIKYAGVASLTCHVDFSLLRYAAQTCGFTTDILEQRQFLDQTGVRHIVETAAQNIAQKNPQELEKYLLGAAELLVDKWNRDNDWRVMAQTKGISSKILDPERACQSDWLYNLATQFAWVGDITPQDQKGPLR